VFAEGGGNKKAPTVVEAWLYLMTTTTLKTHLFPVANFECGLNRQY
jgi:hypothetical protein